MEKKNYYEDLKREERELRQSLKLHGLGFLIGAEVALEENRSLADVIRYGVAGTLATLFFEVTCPKVSGFFKRLL